MLVTVLLEVRDSDIIAAKSDAADVEATVCARLDEIYLSDGFDTVPKVLLCKAVMP